MIQVHTGELRRLAIRLHAIQHAIVSVDDRLKLLLRQSAMDEVWPYALVNLHTGSELDLVRCIEFLHQAADRLEHCEMRIVRNAHARHFEGG